MAWSEGLMRADLTHGWFLLSVVFVPLWYLDREQGVMPSGVSWLP